MEKLRARKVEGFGLDLKIFTKCSFKYEGYPKCDVATSNVDVATLNVDVVTWNVDVVTLNVDVATLIKILSDFSQCLDIKISMSRHGVECRNIEKLISLHGVECCDIEKLMS